jgi:hypothetical protein
VNGSMGTAEARSGWSTLPSSLPSTRVVPKEALSRSLGLAQFLIGALKRPASNRENLSPAAGASGRA